MSVVLSNAKPLAAQLFSASPEHIHLDPVLNGRYERDIPEVQDAVKNLAASIEAHGQQTPAKVRQDKDGKVILVYGYCRYHAVKLINERRAKAGERLLK